MTQYFRWFTTSKQARSILHQSLAIVATLFGLLVLTFFIGRVMPVDPVARIVGPDADNETYMAAFERLGFDQPLYVQFWNYLTQILSGDFGVALLTGHRVADDIIRVFPATVELATVAIIIGAGLGIPLGVLAAVRSGRMSDHIVRVVTLLGHSVPIFWMGMMGLLVFYAWLGWVGGSGRVDVFYEGIVERRTGLLLVDFADRRRHRHFLERRQPHQRSRRSSSATPRWPISAA